MRPESDTDEWLRPWARRLRSLPARVQVPVVAIVYLLTARIGLMLAFEQSNASPVWPPAGIALAAVFLVGRRAAIGVCLGEFAANLVVFLANRPAPLLNLVCVSALIAGGNAIEALLGDWLTRFRPGLRRLPTRVGDGVAFFAMAVAMCVASAAVGSSSLLAGGIISEPKWGTVFLTWWTGDVAGVLVFAPLLLALMERPESEVSPRRTAETLALMVGMVLVAAVPFSGHLPPGFDQALMFLVFPAFLWPVFRLGRHETAVAVALVAIVAIRQTVNGVGPFVHSSTNDALLLLQGFVSIMATTLYALGAAVHGRRAAEALLTRTNASLQIRTEELTELTRRQDALVSERTEQLMESRLAALNMMQDSELSRRQAESAARELELANQRLQESAAAAGKLAEEARAASRAKSEFLAMMSHEIRTPMNGVLGFTHLLVESGLNPKQKQHAEIIQRSGESLLAIINDILDFSKIEAGRLSLESMVFDPRVVVEDVAELFSNKSYEKGLELVLDWCDPTIPPPVVGDPGRLRQILVNLVGNAVKFTRAGHVLIECGSPGTLAVRHPELPASASVPGRTLFCVVDTGIGVPVEKQHLLFQTFSQADSTTTRQFGGTGLGLAISKKLAELMGGEMGMVSTAGSGSVFWFTVPNGNGTVKAEHVDAKLPPSCSPALIVDDHGPSGLALSTRLTAWGVEHRMARSAEEAIEVAQTASAAGRPFAFVLVNDLKGAIDAVFLAGQFRDISGAGAARIVLLSGAKVSTDAAGLVSLGIDAVVQKPVARRKPLREALLPIAERTPPVAVAPLVPATKSPCRVLLAEDIVSNQLLVTQILEALGCRVDLAVNGLEAVAKAESESYDLILMDCQMPEMDGLSATREIRQRAKGKPRVPIIAVTANAVEGERSRCLAAGMDDWITKPVRAAQLRQIVSRFRETGSFTV